MKKLMLAIVAVISGSLLAETLNVSSDMTLTEMDSLAGYDAIKISQGATLTFNIAEGYTLEVPCPLNGKGSVVKNGKGEVDYTYVNTSKAVYTDYYIESPGETTINDGILKLPTYTEAYWWSGNKLGRFTVNKPGKLDIGANSQAEIYGLWGDGEVTASFNGSYNQLALNPDKTNPPSKFYGLISGTIRQRVAGGKSDIMSTDNTNNGEMALGTDCSIGIMKFGDSWQTGSLGTSIITTRGPRGVIRYLGEGETATRTFVVGSGADQLEIDAGEKGNLVLTGGTTANSGAAAKFVLSGNNSEVCEYSGKITKGTSPSVTLVKKGAGTWKVTNTANEIDEVLVEGGELVVKGPAARIKPTYFKFIFKDVYGREGVNNAKSDEANIELEEIAFYDKDGNRILEGFTHAKTYDEYTTGDYTFKTPFPDLSDIQPGQYGMVANPGVSQYTYYGNRDANCLLDNKKTDPTYTSTYGGAPYSNAKYWPTILFRMPEDAPEVVSFDIGSSSATTGNRAVTKWELQVSEDGKDWYTAYEYEERDPAKRPGHQKWFSDLSSMEFGDSVVPRQGFMLPKEYAIAGIGASTIENASKVTITGGKLTLDGVSELPMVNVAGGSIYVDDSSFEIGDTLFTVPAASTLESSGVSLKRKILGYYAEIVTESEVKKAVLRYDEKLDLSEYADYVQLMFSDPVRYPDTDDGTWHSYSYCYEGGWSDGAWPTADKNYYVPAGITLTLPHGQNPNTQCHIDHGVTTANPYWGNLQFYGGKLAVSGSLLSSGKAPNLNGYPFMIADLTMLAGSSFTVNGEEPHVIGKFGAGCKMTIKSNKDNPFTIYGAQFQNNDYLIRSDLYGDENAVIKLVNKNPVGSYKNNVSLDGAASMYKGLVIVGANEVLNITNGVFGGKIKLEGGSVKIDLSKFGNPAGYGSRVFAFVTDKAEFPEGATIVGEPANKIEYRYNSEEGLFEAWMSIDRIPSGVDYGQYLKNNGFIYKSVDEYVDADKGIKYQPDAVDNGGDGKRYSSIVRTELWKIGSSPMGDEFVDGDYASTARVFFNDYDYGEFVGRSLTFISSSSTLRADWWTALSCKDLRFQDGAFIFNAGGGNKTITLGGKMTIIGTSEFRSGAQPNSKDVLKVDAKFCGDSKAVFNVKRSADGRSGEKELYFTGDCSEYLGTLNIREEGSLSLGNAGFPEGTIVIEDSAKGLKVSGSNSVVVKNLTIAGGQSISLNGKGFVVIGNFTKTGSGSVRISVNSVNVEPGAEKAIFSVPNGMSESDFTIGALPYGWKSEFKNNALYVTVPEPTSAKRIAVLGDSITHGGHWPYFLQMLDALRNPGSADVYLNCGISGDTTAGALGRLDDDVLMRSPDKVLVMFGMNDVGRNYYAAEATQQQITARENIINTTFPNNLNLIVDRLRTAGKEIVLVTPTPYDQYGDYEGAQENYPTCNSIGLAGIAEKVRAIASENELDVIDFHAPMTAIYESLSEVTEKAKRFNRVDRVHPEVVGHALMSVIAWNELGNTEPYSDQTFVASGSTFSTTYTPSGLPLPANAEFNRAKEVAPELYTAINREIVKITGLDKGSYDLKAGDTVLGTFTEAELAAGINLAELNIPGKAVALEAYKKALAIQTKGSVMRGVVMMEVQAKKNNSAIDLTDFSAVCANLDAWIKGVTSNKDYYQNLVNSYKSYGSQEQQASMYGQIDSLTAELKLLAVPASYTLSVEKNATPKTGAIILFK